MTDATQRFDTKKAWLSHIRRRLGLANMEGGEIRGEEDGLRNRLTKETNNYKKNCRKEGFGIVYAADSNIIIIIIKGKIGRQ